MLMVRMLEARRQSVMLWRLLVTQLTTAASGSCRLKSASAIDAEDVPGLNPLFRFGELKNVAWAKLFHPRRRLG